MRTIVDYVMLKLGYVPKIEYDRACFHRSNLQRLVLRLQSHDDILFIDDYR